MLYPALKNAFGGNQASNRKMLSSVAFAPRSRPHINARAQGWARLGGICCCNGGVRAWVRARMGACAHELITLHICILPCHVHVRDHVLDEHTSLKKVLLDIDRVHECRGVGARAGLMEMSGFGVNELVGVARCQLESLNCHTHFGWRQRSCL